MYSPWNHRWWTPEKRQMFRKQPVTGSAILALRSLEWLRRVIQDPEELGYRDFYGGRSQKERLPEAKQAAYQKGWDEAYNWAKVLVVSEEYERNPDGQV